MAGNALIVGAGAGISASFARLWPATAARSRSPRGGPTSSRPRRPRPAPACMPATWSTRRRWRGCSRSSTGSIGALDVVLYNPSYRTRGPLVELDPAEVEKSLMVSAYGGFLVAQQAARRMLRQGRGAILFTGASASVKGYKHSAPFAMGKFALRGLAQSIARELAPENIHVAHFVIDGGCAARYARSRRAVPTACSTRTRSRRPTGASSSSRAAPGPGRSSCAPGSKTSVARGPRSVQLRGRPVARRAGAQLSRRAAGPAPASRASTPWPGRSGAIALPSSSTSGSAMKRSRPKPWASR